MISCYGNTGIKHYSTQIQIYFTLQKDEEERTQNERDVHFLLIVVTFTLHKVYLYKPWGFGWTTKNKGEGLITSTGAKVLYYNFGFIY